jgi:hypothetical protein
VALAAALAGGGRAACVFHNSFAVRRPVAEPNCLGFSSFSGPYPRQFATPSANVSRNTRGVRPNAPAGAQTPRTGTTASAGAGGWLTPSLP